MQPVHSPRQSPTIARRLAAGVIALACVLGVAATGLAIEPTSDRAVDRAQGEGRWQVLEVVGEGFRGLLPRHDTWEESGLRETIAGTVDEKKYFGRTDGRTFSIGLHRLPNLGRFFAPTSLVLSTAKKNVLRTDFGREVSYERRRMGDYPGALLTFEPTRESDEFDLVEVHLVLVGSRLYVLKATDPELGGDRSDVDRFFASFEVLD